MNPLIKILLKIEVSMCPYGHIASFSKNYLNHLNIKYEIFQKSDWKFRENFF